MSSSAAVGNVVLVRCSLQEMFWGFQKVSQMYYGWGSCMRTYLSSSQTCHMVTYYYEAKFLSTGLCSVLNSRIVLPYNHPVNLAIYSIKHYYQIIF